MAEEFKEQYTKTRFIRRRKAKEGETAPDYERSAKSQHSRIRTLKAVFRWFAITKITTSNPFASIKTPELGRPEVKYVRREEIAAFFAWLRKRFPKCEMPVLFFSVKALAGCRLEDICQLESSQLRDGRLEFAANQTKNRSERCAVLSKEVYKAFKILQGTVLSLRELPGRIAHSE